MAISTPATVEEFGRELARLFNEEGPEQVVAYAREHMAAMRPLMTPDQQRQICGRIVDLAYRLTGGDGEGDPLEADPS